MSAVGDAGAVAVPLVIDDWSDEGSVFDQKYILVRITHASSSSSSPPSVMMYSADCDYHRELYDELCSGSQRARCALAVAAGTPTASTPASASTSSTSSSSSSALRIDVLGGGILRIDPAARRAETFGKSGAYGKPPVDLVRAALTARFAPLGFAVDARVTDLVRG